MDWQGMFAYINIGVGFGVARFDGLGNARALHGGTGSRLAPRFLYVCLNHKILETKATWSRCPKTMEINYD